MQSSLILASSSEIRRNLLMNAGVIFEVQTVRIDEIALRRKLRHKKLGADEIALALASEKAGAVSANFHASRIIGADQILDFQGELLTKPASKQEAVSQLSGLSGRQHVLYSGVAVYHMGARVWHHVGRAVMHMRKSSDRYISDYVERNWPQIQHTVGAYQLEHEGVRLFENIEGDFFTVLGLPLLPLLGYLTDIGELPG